MTHPLSCRRPTHWLSEASTTSHGRERVPKFYRYRPTFSETSKSSVTTSFKMLERLIDFAPLQRSWLRPPTGPIASSHGPSVNLHVAGLGLLTHLGRPYHKA